MKKGILFISLITATIIVVSQERIDFIFSNVNIIPISQPGVLENQDVLINEGKIIKIQKHEKGNKYLAETVVDCSGQFMLPTLSDAHAHLPKSEEEIDKFVKLNLINGVTKVRSMRGDWKHPKIAEKYDTSTTLPIKMYVSAPPFHKSFDLSAEKIKRYVSAAKQYGFDFIKILSVKNDTIFNTLNSFCVNENTPISGHFPSNLSDSVIFNSNYNCFEHLGGMVDIEDSLLNNRIESIKKNNIYISPTLSWYVTAYGQYSIDYMLQQRGMEFFSDSIKQVWAKGTREYRDKLGVEGFKKEKEIYADELKVRYKVLKKLSDQKVNLLLSPDASTKYVLPGFGMVEEMKLYEKAEVSKIEILKAATLNFANFFGDSSYGTIDIRKDADFILLDNNPLDEIDALEKVHSVFFNNQYISNQQIIEIKQELLSGLNQ